MQDYYKIIGLKPSATDSEIKKAFRKKALKLHPDKSGESTAQAFLELYEAYAVLASPTKRKRYDKIYSPSIISEEGEEWKGELKSIARQGQEYAQDFKKLKRDVLFFIFINAIFLEKTMVASLAAIVFGVSTFVSGIKTLQWELILIGIGLVLLGLGIGRYRYISLAR